MVRRRRTSVGQAEVMGALIALGLLIVVMSALLTSLFKTSTTSTIGFAQRAQFESYKSSERLGVIYEGNRCYLINVGSVEVEIVRAWVLEGGQFKNVSIDLNLKPNERTSDIPDNVIYVVTSRGNVFPFNEECRKQIRREVAKALEVPFITFPFSTLTNLLTNNVTRVMDPGLVLPPNRESVINSIVKGLIRIGRGGQTYAYVINKTFENVYIDFEGLLAGTTIIGFSPEWIYAGALRNAVNYSILLDIVELTSCERNDKRPVCSYYSYTAKAMVGNQNLLNILSSGGAGGSVRVKILNFRPDNVSIAYDFNVVGLSKAKGKGALQGTSYVKLDNEDSIGIYPYSGTKYVGYAGIKFKGYASKVFIYTLITVSSGQSTSYEPYILIADTNGNLLPELIFDTIDISFLPESTKITSRLNYLPDTRDVNLDVTDLSGQTVALDYSLYPLLMEFLQIPVNGSIYSGLEVLARVFFMDNIAFESGSGVITDYGRALLGFGLMNSQGRLIASLNYTYQDLALAQSLNTYVGFWTTLRNPLIIPYSNEVFKVVMILQDPYKYDQPSSGTYTNHADFIIGVELVSVISYARGG